MDILHATPFSHPVNVHGGTFADLAGCALVIVAAG
jgi:malate/lactate dehydrogenase